MRSPFLLWLFALWGCFIAPSALAHPVSQGAIEVVIYADRVTLLATVSVQEVCVAGKLRVDDEDKYAPGALNEAFAKHAQYLLKHLYLTVDGKVLTGVLVKIVPPEKAAAGIFPFDVEKQFVAFDFVYAIPPATEPGKTVLPQDLTLKHDALNEIMYTPGVPWQATYYTKLRQSDQDEFNGTLLVCNEPVVWHCEWKAVPPTPKNTVQTPASPVQPSQPVENQITQTRQSFWSLTGTYLKAGIRHIVGFDDPGYDHILFVSALVLAAVSFWDVIKVVTAFTLAHTLSLTLSVLKIVSVSEHIVEPMIAASIVFVALQNVIWPEKSRGWARLAAAFGFGLFHGLGFAGGLVNSMRGETGMSIAVAIAAFSIGVEVGHQIVVLPMFGLLQWGRRSRMDETARALFTARTMKYGSMLICAGGTFFLFYALKGG